MDTLYKTLSDILSILKDVVPLITGLFVVWIAYEGLQTWKRQLKGNEEYQTARNLLRAVYKLRNAISYVRGPFIGPSEYDAAYKEAGIEVDLRDTREKTFAKRQEALYQYRWKRISEAMLELDLATFEAEILWKSDIVDRLNSLKDCVAELHTSIQIYLRNLADPSSPAINEKMLLTLDQNLYDSSNFIESEGGKNEFTNKINKSISGVEGFIRPHLDLS